ncbi:MAG TPA: metallopeptidase TldD-related protein [Phycisphaerae bacterium]|nr:metallopeptidase TldD-related protein [Phycisphaerae bacterium]
MMRSISAIVLLIVCVSWNRAAADDKVQTEVKKDVVLRALVDELERGKDGLKLEDLQRPYFIEYGLGDTVSSSAGARLGALTSSSENRWRRLRTSIRVGSYDQDNTNFSGDYGGYYFSMFGGMGGADIPIEDDYNAIRQGIWWATDREYKSVIENYERKLAFMKTKVIEDKPPDFSHEDPTVSFEDRVEVAISLKDLEKMATDLSRIFLEYPDVQSSSVNINGTAGNKYLVNTEGTRLRVGDARFSLTISATVQADDGMRLSDSINVYARKLDGLPSMKDLSERCRKMVQQLVAIKNAPKLESYTGPVLFEPRAAAVLFSQRFAGQFAGGQRPIGSQSNPDDFEKKLNKRILPKFLNVVDDPTKESIDGQVVMGHYLYDDQGVKVRPVTLVEGGRLKTLVMSRNPSKTFKKSTGHGRGDYRPSPSVGCLVVTSSDAQAEQALRRKLLEACADEDLEFGIRIAVLGSAEGDSGRYSEYLSSLGISGFARGGGEGGTPLAMYKVYPDGHEELVRGAEIARFDLKAFKRMLAAGDKPYVLNSGGTGGRTVVAPGLLFEELDLAKIERDFDKPPILPNPLARAQKPADEADE